MLKLPEQSAGSLAWLAVLLLVPGLLIFSPTGRLFFIALSAALALVVLAFGSTRRRVFAAVVLAVCAAIGAPTYVEHRQSYDRYLKR